MLDIATVITYVLLIAVNDGHQGNVQGHQYARGHVHHGGHVPSQDLDHAPGVLSIHDTVAVSATMCKFPKSLWICEFAVECEKGNSNAVGM